jgi:hypothetical protein
LLSKLLALPLQIIGGYKGSAEIRLAMASGEVDGVCLLWSGVKAGWPDQTGLATVIQAGTRAHPELPRVPLAWTMTPHADARELLGTVFDAVAAAGRFYTLAAATPSDRRDLIRRAFLETMRDPDYVNETRTLGLTLDPVGADELTARVRALLDLPPRTVQTLKQALLP